MNFEDFRTQLEAQLETLIKFELQEFIFQPYNGQQYSWDYHYEHANHPAYNDFVDKQLNEITQLGPLSEKSLRELIKLRKDLIQLIEQAGSEGKTINEFF